VVMCLGQGADLHMAQLMPLPLTISCSSKSRLALPTYFTFLVSAHPGSPKQNPTHTRPFYSCLDSVRDNPGEPVPEETFTHSHLSWSSVIPHLLPPSTSYSIHFFTQSLSSFCSTCSYHRNLFCYSTDILSSNSSLSLNLYFELYFVA